MKLDAKTILETIQIQAIEKEMDVLRDQYFYDAKHEDFNTLYYEFLEAINKDGLSTSKRLAVCEKFFLKAVEYMNLYYPNYRVDTDILTFEPPAEKPKRPKTSKSRSKKKTKRNRPYR